MDANERRKRASAEAADWFVCLQEEDLPRASREQYIDWLRDSPTHVAEMIRVAQIHGGLEQFERWERITTGSPQQDSAVVSFPSSPQERGRGEGSSRNAWFTALAATLAAVLVTAAFVLPKVRGQVIGTERGERREVVLSDGSIVQVDPESRLRVKFEDNVRQVYLDRGRALFRAEKDPSRPFIVRVQDTMVRAVGTAFGVERQKLGVIITVAEGKVAVLPPSSMTRGDKERSLSSERQEWENSEPADPISGSGEGEEGREVLLSAGHQLTVQRAGSTKPVRKVDTARELAWAEGRLIFDNEPVAQAVEEFNRYNRLQLQVTDPLLAARPVSGVFSASDPESFIAFIQTVASVSVIRRDDHNVTILAGRGK